MTEDSWGLYVHIPFCRRKCFYCDFVSYACQEHVMPQYISALIEEMRGKKKLFGVKSAPTTVYIGGGTPTVLPPVLFMRLVRAIGEIFFGGRIDRTVEFTVEANPGTVDEDYLQMLHNGGINRLSIGAQSFNESLLRTAGRIHSPDDIISCVQTAKKAGFTNISIDIMYGLPTETTAVLRRDLAAVTALDVPHISVYGLTIESGTKFAALSSAGQLPLPSEDTLDAMYDFVTVQLPKENFRRYEISNYARAGFESRHNMGYWLFRPYLGVGAAAHSFWLKNAPVVGERFFNPADLAEYFRNVTAANFHGQSEGERDEKIARAEFCFLALRSADGIDCRKFAAHFGAPPQNFFGKTIERLKERAVLAEGNGKIALTPLGMKYGNMVFAEFL